MHLPIFFFYKCMPAFRFFLDSRTSVWFFFFSFCTNGSWNWFEQNAVMPVTPQRLLCQMLLLWLWLLSQWESTFGANAAQYCCSAEAWKEDPLLSAGWYNLVCYEFQFFSRWWSKSREAWLNNYLNQYSCMPLAINLCWPLLLWKTLLDRDVPIQKWLDRLICVENPLSHLEIHQ